MMIDGSVEEIIIKGNTYIIGCEVQFDSTGYAFSFTMQNGPFHLDQNHHFMKICAAYGITDIKDRSDAVPRADKISASS